MTAKGDDIGEGTALTQQLRVQEGMALAALSRRTEAEAILLGQTTPIRFRLIP